MKSLFLLSFLSFVAVQLSAQSKISSVTAKLFYNQDKQDDGFGSKPVSGNFSDDVIGKEDLFNTIIGEGYAEGYSHQTLIVVDITSRGMSNKDQLLKITVTANNKVVLQVQKKFSVIGDNALYKMPFLVYDTGCDPLKIKTELISAGKASSVMSKTVDFMCGE